MKLLFRALTLSTVALTLGQLLLFPPRGPAWPDLLLWGLGAWLLERSTRSLPGWNWGRFSLQMPWLLVALVKPDQPSALPLLALLSLALVLRPWLRPRLELLADLWAVQWVAPGLLLGRSQPLWLVWPVVSLLGLLTQTRVLRQLAADQPGRASWMRLELTLTGQRWAAWWVASAALWVSGPQVLKLLWLPGLLGLAWGAQNAAFRLQAESFERLQSDLRRALLDREAWQRNARLLEQLHQLTLGLEAAGRAEQLLEPLHRYFPLRSLALFGPDQQPLAVRSPQAQVLENLWQWGGHLELRETHGPRVLNAAWLTLEPQALLLPCGSGWLYLGREAGGWSQDDFAQLAPAIQRVAHRLQELLGQQGVGQQLIDSHQHGQQLQQTIVSQQFLLHCAERLLQPVQGEALWAELEGCLSQVLSLQSLCWIQADQLRARRGALPPEEARGWLPGLGPGTAYLARADRPRWPQALGADPGVDNLVVLGLGAEGHLWIGFSGEFTLEPQQLRALQGLGNLFSGAAQRLRLNQQLEESRQLWLNSQKSLGQAQLAAGLAHELNSPLAAVQLALEATLLRSPSDRLKTALDACQRARSILERLQLVTREHREASQHQDLVQVLRSLVEQLPQRPEPLAWNGPESLLVAAPRSLLEQALLPLLTNAMEAGGGMQLSWGVQEDGQAWVRVADGGAGIPLEIRSRLGQFFFTTKPLGRHLGLGLASLDQACRQLGGSWHIESPPQGACLRLCLPTQR